MAKRDIGGKSEGSGGGYLTNARKAPGLALNKEAGSRATGMNRVLEGG